ncbi:uncharacterized protein BP01DRAFT_354780 [Aspergillus saccharolyticus JOP 1030-1]|uniref:Transmembrane protein 135 N-terminal domain-containing protein n=1 Tax=Aspergillus saccharolyticus JOP 1030-1 TaxID=1450539 RepID=A0A318ZJ33_9EURO|nr:hypothetical protein BP01DRAFT_354780 [Aspergillus saccharolyticus JOP 1030-1]PYH47576.1 hypothetical protein BP01DRAFT_354780 [Aspergillus saccharolyticus JOP 1030-1]
MASDISPDPRSHPVVRSLLRISLSAKEYKRLHDYAIQRAPSSFQGRLPSPSKYEAIIRSKNKHNAAAVRASLRVFLLSLSLTKLAEGVMSRIRGDIPSSKSSISSTRSSKLRVSASFALILLFHRFLYRFFVKLRANLRTDDARPFRDRNPRISQVLTSRFAPAIGGSLAGFALGICPRSQFRIIAAIYSATRGLEFLFNVLDEKGWFENRPSWFGSWLLMPVACAQLFHSFIFDREAVPTWLTKVILGLSPSYIGGRPDSLPMDVAWPGKEDVVDSLAHISALKWPSFVSPILHPGSSKVLPSSLTSISPVTGSAHPAISSLSCALLHPSSPSCSTAFLHHILLSVPPLTRFLTAISLALSLRKIKNLALHPISSLNDLSQKIMKLTAVLSASAGTAWASICLWNSVLPRSTLPTKRFYLSGALAGVPFAVLGSKRGLFLYFFRTALATAWKTAAKRGSWTGWNNGELGIIVASWALVGCILESRPAAVQGKGVRKALSWMRGDGFADPLKVAEKRKAKKAAAAQKKTEDDAST